MVENDVVNEHNLCNNSVVKSEISRTSAGFEPVISKCIEISTLVYANCC